MGNIYFNYQGEKYIIFFYPCGNMASVTKIKTNKTRDIKYSKAIKLKDFLSGLGKINFNY